MGQLRDKETGQVITLYGNDEVRALESQRYESVSGKPVTAELNGHTVQLTPEEIASQTHGQTAVSGSHTAALTADQIEAYKESLYNSPEHASEAFGYGVLNPLTLGTLDIARAKLGADTGAEKYNPGWRTAGEIFGVAGTLGLGAEAKGAQGVIAGLTPASWLARGGLAAERALGGGIAGTTARFGIEGFGYGAAQGIGQLALDDPEFTSEALAGTILEHGLIGGATGSAFGFLGGVSEKFLARGGVGSEFGERALKPGPDLELATGFGKREAAAARSVAPETLASTVDKATAGLKKVQNAVRTLEEVAEQTNKLERTLTNAGKASDNAADNLFAGVLERQGSPEEIAAYLKRRNDVTAPGLAKKPRPVEMAENLAATKKELEKTLGGKLGSDSATKNLLRATPEEAAKVATTLDNYVSQLDNVIAATPDETLALKAKGAKDAIKEVIDELPKDDVSELLGSIGLDPAQIQGGSQDIMKLWMQGKGPDGLPFQHQGPVGVHVEKPGLFEKLKGQAEKAGVNPVHLVNQVAQAQASPVAGMLGVAQYLWRRKGALLNGIGTATAKIGQKGSKVGGKPAAALFNAINLRGGREEKPATTRKAFERLASELNTIMANPRAFQLELNQRLADVRAMNFEVGDIGEAKVMKIIEFLHNKMPKDPGNLLNMGKSTWVANDQEIYEFLQYVKGAVAPLQVYQEAIAGRASAASVEALKVANPESYNKIRLAFFEHLSAGEFKLSYDQQNSLGNMFDMQLNSASSPENRQFFREMYAASKEQEQPIKISSGGVSQAPTEAQKLQGR